MSVERHCDQVWQPVFLGLSACAPLLGDFKVSWPGSLPVLTLLIMAGQVLGFFLTRAWGQPTSPVCTGIGGLVHHTVVLVPVTGVAWTWRTSPWLKCHDGPRLFSVLKPDYALWKQTFLPLISTPAVLTLELIVISTLLGIAYLLLAFSPVLMRREVMVCSSQCVLHDNLDWQPSPRILEQGIAWKHEHVILTLFCLNYMIFNGELSFYYKGIFQILCWEDNFRI